MLLMNQLNAHQAHLCHTPLLQGLDSLFRRALSFPANILTLCQVSSFSFKSAVQLKREKHGCLAALRHLPASKTLAVPITVTDIVS